MNATRQLSIYLCSQNRFQAQAIAFATASDDACANSYRSLTGQAKNLAVIDVPTPPLPTQRGFVVLQAKVQGFRVSHVRIRTANADLLSATLERLFGDPACSTE